MAAVGLAVAAACGPGGNRPGAETLDLPAIFRCTAPAPGGQAACDHARELILFNCSACHLVVRIVLKQADAEGWDGVLARHRARVAQMSDAEFREIRDYLIANFRPDLPPPALPPDLAAQF